MHASSHEALWNLFIVKNALCSFRHRECVSLVVVCANAFNEHTRYTCVFVFHFCISFHFFIFYLNWLKSFSRIPTSSRWFANKQTKRKRNPCAFENCRFGVILCFICIIIISMVWKKHFVFARGVSVATLCSVYKYIKRKQLRQSMIWILIDKM